MPTIIAQDGTQIYYKDWGSGQPVVFSHGWPLSGSMFGVDVKTGHKS
jgi:non-heme chloroperoxidase